MEKSLAKLIHGYKAFRSKYALGDHAVMHHLASDGQHPEIMIVGCCDSRVDPALILQCDPGDLFVVRNIANIIPPYIVNNNGYHDTAAALEFGITHLKIKHLIILGHSQCGGIHALVNDKELSQNEFISQWVSLIKKPEAHFDHIDNFAKLGLSHSYHNCLTFPWIKQLVDNNLLAIHQWFFNIDEAEVLVYSHTHGKFIKLDEINIKENI
jgi:carbonic anhydrase